MKSKRFSIRSKPHYWVILIAAVAFLSFSFRKKENRFYNTDWLIIAVDTNARGFKKVDPKNRVLLRIQHDVFKNIYVLDGSSSCCAQKEVRERKWADCWMRSSFWESKSKTKGEYPIGVRGDVDNLGGFPSVLTKTEYSKFLTRFLVESNGMIKLRNDTLVFDMKNHFLGKEIPFKIKCIRDTLKND